MIRFGLFDWLDESGRGLEQTYEERLQVLELADRSGMYAYHLAEHHGTALSTVASPNLFLSALAQRTERLRLGPLAYVLPLYNPLRLMEEICMLDNLSKGRMELGISRGVSAFEFAPYKIDLAENRAIYQETFDVLLQGFTTGRVDHHGKYFQYDNVSTQYQPRQKPYPPLWYPTSNANSIDWAARNGISTAFSIHFAPDYGAIKKMVDAYKASYEEHKSEPGRLNAHVKEPLIGVSCHIHVAATDEQAVAQARQGYTVFHHNFMHLRMSQQDEARYDHPLAFDTLHGNGRFFAGSPDTVRKQAQELLSATGANYLLGNFSFGSLPLQQQLTSLELFAKEVMPAFDAVPA